MYFCEADVIGELAIKNIEYRYGANDKPIFQNLNLKVENGHSIAIIGISGSGKSTLLKCISGLLKPTEGQILIDGQTLSTISSAIAVVLQDDHLFAGTIAENITFFDELPNVLIMEECARAAGIFHVIAGMPLQFQTTVGDMGNSLSAGQVQRIMIARALYKRPKILVFDEATSHLDLMTEKFINSSIKKMNVTRIIVAHRPETILSADHIYSLELDSLKKIDRNEFMDALERHKIDYVN